MAGQGGERPVASRLKDVVNDALELVRDERDEFLVRVCSGDDRLLGEARRMLDVHAQLGRFLEPPDVSRRLWARAFEQGAGATPRPALVGEVLDDRYQLEERLGTGSSGTVYDSADLLTGERVAVKVLTGLPHGDIQWFRRELAALRLLELPGVVRLLDDGVHGDLPFLVMPRLEGTRFPGRRTPIGWADLAETAIALLETLARIHARGVVHGDLKPANVLVDARGRPTVLDLGVSSGPSVPGKVEGIAGTPAYLAPEQLLGEQATPQSDLYSVGVMLHEALAGANPHPAHDLDTLVQARLSGSAPTLRQRGVDPATCPLETIDSLLAPEPANRERSAAHVAARLRGEMAPLEVLRNHPVLQLDKTIDALVEAAQRSKKVTFFGPPRSGRSRCLRQVAGRLRRVGRTVHWFDPQDAGPPPAADVIVVDGAGTEVGDAEFGCVIRVVEEPEPTSIRIEPLGREELRELFGGSDRIFHLREDSAHELYRRTKGWQLRVVEELSAWVRAGVAQVEERAVVIERSALDLLAGGFRVCPVPDDGRGDPDPLLGVLAAAGPVLSQAGLADATRRSPEEVSRALAVLVREGRVEKTAEGLYETTSDSSVSWPGPKDHEAAARGIAPGTPGRLRHLVAAERADEIADEVRRATLVLMRDARVGRARAVATEGLASVRGHGLGPSHELALLSALLLVAAAEGTERSFELALYEMGRASFETEELARLERLARVALLALRRDGDRALALADALGPFPDMKLEQLRHSARAMAARSGQRDRSEEVLESVERWAAEHDAEDVRRKVLEWKGWASYVQGRYKEAVAKHEQAMGLAHDTQSRMSGLVKDVRAAQRGGDLHRGRLLRPRARTGRGGEGGGGSSPPPVLRGARGGGAAVCRLPQRQRRLRRPGADRCRRIAAPVQPRGAAQPQRGRHRLAAGRRGDGAQAGSHRAAAVARDRTPLGGPAYPRLSGRTRRGGQCRDPGAACARLPAARNRVADLRAARAPPPRARPALPQARAPVRRADRTRVPQSPARNRVGRGMPGMAPGRREEKLMAPQLGMGTFRIDQYSTADAYAMANGSDKEFWALRLGSWVKPQYPSPSVSIHIEPILAAPSPVNLAAFCAFLRYIGEDPAHFEIREHSITPRTCAKKKG